MMLKNIIELYKEGNSAKEISRKLSIPLSTVYFYIRKSKLEDSVQKEYVCLYPRIRFGDNL